MISVVLLGAGNVATHLYKAFQASKDVSVKQWFNRSLKSIETYKNKVETTDDLSKLVEADVYILAVSDDAIAELSSQLPFENRFVVHTSGSVSAYDIDKKNRRGVFYPLQTFSQGADIDFSTVPICYEALMKKDYDILELLALIGSMPV